MKEHDIASLHALPKVFPNIPYARYAPGLGSRKGTEASINTNLPSAFNIRVVGLYCTRARKEEEAAPVVKQEDGEEVSSTAKRSIYVRVQFEKAVIDTLPLEVMREKYPQVLIDYLLSTAVWA
uniref:Uncharacterized protein n=1 Tax=Trypanosoma congolense (strain IL3000) TaxID=1068625 RepID=G0V282_TRYCI|nr:hypothetical protein, unlikely [Trypanosoma congolense IL3000]